MTDIVMRGADVAWQTLPLCRRLAMATFQQVPIGSQDGGGGRRLLWALGFLNSGDRELLGSWCATADAGSPWKQVLGSMRLRGLEEIRIAISPLGDKDLNVTLASGVLDPGAMPSIAMVIDSRLLDLASDGNLDHRELLRVPSHRVQQRIVAWERTAQEISRRLHRECRRRGYCDDDATVLRSVDDLLTQLEGEPGPKEQGSRRTHPRQHAAIRVRAAAIGA